MKYGGHQNYCNGPGDCSCGEDYREFASSCVDTVINDTSQDEICKLKAQVKYWKRKAKRFQATGGSPLVPAKMEQLWLAFVLKKKYNKVWDGKEWVEKL